MILHVPGRMFGDEPGKIRLRGDGNQLQKLRILTGGIGQGFGAVPEVGAEGVVGGERCLFRQVLAL